MEMLLSKGEVLNLEKSARKGLIVCTRGACWLTCTGQPGDHLLRAGDSLAISGRGRLVLNALRDCRVRVEKSRQPLQIEAAAL